MSDQVFTLHYSLQKFCISSSDVPFVGKIESAPKQVWMKDSSKLGHCLPPISRNIRLCCRGQKEYFSLTLNEHFSTRTLTLERESSSFQFLKVIYPGYLFAKLHSTLFLLSTLSFIQKAPLQKHLQHCFYHHCNIVKNFISKREIWQRGPTISKLDFFQ